MGGLSAGAFLAREGKPVLILEKHNKPGGYVTSFTKRGYTFDCQYTKIEMNRWLARMLNETSNCAVRSQNMLLCRNESKPR